MAIIPTVVAAWTHCWNANGMQLDTDVMSQGSSYAVTGKLSNIPLTGVAIVTSPGQTAELGFLLNQAKTSAYAVVWEVTLDIRNNLNGTGHFRWTDNTNFGNATLTRITCPSSVLEEEQPEEMLGADAGHL